MARIIEKKVVKNISEFSVHFEAIIFGYHHNYTAQRNLESIINNFAKQYVLIHSPLTFHITRYIWTTAINGLKGESVLTNHTMQQTYPAIWTNATFLSILTGGSNSGKTPHLVQEFPDFKPSRNLISSSSFKRSLVLRTGSFSEICHKICSIRTLL